jgi:type II secretory pathway component PulJ
MAYDLTNVGLLVALVALSILITYLFRVGQQRAIKLRAAQDLQAQLLAGRATQEWLGEELHQALIAAALENPNMGDERHLTIEKQDQGTGVCSILVYLVEGTCSDIMMQCCIYTDRLRWFYDPEGRSEEAQVGEFQRMLGNAREKVIAFA